jgi:hypothetical protein
MRGLSNNRAGHLTKELGFLAFILLLVSGCTCIGDYCLPETHPARYQCNTISTDPKEWQCKKDGFHFRCEGISEEQYGASINGTDSDNN